MRKRKHYSEKDLTNMARGFDAPAKEDHLEKLRAQAREMEWEQTQSQDRKPERKKSLSDLHREDAAKREMERDRERTRGRNR